MKRIAAIMSDDSGVDAQALLAGAAGAARALGMTVAGVLAEDLGFPDRICAAGTLRNIATGRGHTIYLPVAPPGTSCHLDPSGVEDACAEILDELDGADLVILSKFGKLEAGGTGLFRAFEAVIAFGKPILTTVSGRHHGVFGEHVPEAHIRPANEAGIIRWLHSLLSPAQLDTRRMTKRSKRTDSQS